MAAMVAGRRPIASGKLTDGTSVAGPKKELGQHWLKDHFILEDIADAVTITKHDTVLEIGPGLGTLTSHLLRRAGNVVAVELDADLAAKLPNQFPGTSLTVVNQDILSFDLTTLPKDYIVVANVPYYITAKIVQLLTQSSHRPKAIVLLVQKEVAQRLAATPGDMSLLSLSAGVHAEIGLGSIVEAKWFTPPPKVDSQVVILTMRPAPLLTADEEAAVFRLARFGFSGKRKKLRGSLAAGLHIPKQQVDEQLAQVGIDSNLRAEDLSIQQWRDAASVLVMLH